MWGSGSTVACIPLLPSSLVGMRGEGGLGVSGEKSLDESAEESQSKEGSRGPCLRLAMQSMFSG